jgi:hypothetical protein
LGRKNKGINIEQIRNEVEIELVENAKEALRQKVSSMIDENDCL